MLNTTEKWVLVLTLAVAPLAAFAQSAGTITTTPAMTGTVTTGTTGTADTTGTGNTTSTQNNAGFDCGWLGLLGLAGLAGLRRQTPVVMPERTTSRA